MKLVAPKTCHLAAPLAVLLPLASLFVFVEGCDSTVSAQFVEAGAASDASDGAAVESDAASNVGVDGPVADAADAALQACPIGAEARALVAEVLARGFLDGKYVSMESHPPDPPFNGRVAQALSLVGTTETHLQSFTPLQPCTVGTPNWYAAYCDPIEAYGPGDFGEKFGRCSRSGCDANGNFVAESYYTLRPQLESTPRHAISYPFEAIVGSPLVGRTGTVDWAENPFQSWTRVVAVGGSLTATANSSRAVSVALAGGATFDLSATTHTEVIKSATEETERILFEASFTKLTTAGAIAGSVETTDPTEQVISGTVKLGDVILATATAGSAMAPTLQWQGVCQ